MKRFKVKILFVVIIVLIVALIGAVVYYTRAFQTTSADRLPDLYDGSRGTIEPYKSKTDKDKDGIDDQSDILENAISYIKTKPKYKSKYYGDTGYSNDRYGVCTDLVAFALKGAGYDMMKMVNDDITHNPNDYDIDTVDKYIDFRRVANLRVFFEHTEAPLTLDVNDIDQWQGGDIIVFKKHIGIVSDRRNKNGVPYVIHHNGNFQKSYEEDILEKRKDIVGHYRISE